ncbi:hypothetical protein SDC9_164447 [bioreactor metagenome]|uniref:Uncharacterized protein n=1 Tax=bioreactor metagenome TaxID=1076179 RepID=A0A645FRP0_9ZZZZ
MELISDCLVKQHSSNGRVYSAREAQDHFVISNGLLEVAHSAFDKGSGGPVTGASTNSICKILEH